MRLTGAAPHPALRATFPRRVKALVVVEKFPAKVQSLRARQRLPPRGSWQNRQGLTEGVCILTQKTGRAARGLPDLVFNKSDPYG